MENAAQQAVWRWEQWEPFGLNPADENPSGLGAFEFPLRFPGQYADKETNLHYNYFRDYDPQIGRYVQSDPIGLRGGINLYAYVDANPLGSIDPNGENPLVGALLGALGDVGVQLAFNGGGFECVKWDVVAIAAFAGAFNPFSGLNAARSAIKAERQFARAMDRPVGSRVAKRALQRGDRHNSRSMKEAGSWALVELGAEGVGSLVPDERHIRIADSCECRTSP